MERALLAHASECYIHVGDCCALRGIDWALIVPKRRLFANIYIFETGLSIDWVDCVKDAARAADTFDVMFRW